MEKVARLRRKFPRFIYESFHWEIKKRDLAMSFSFLIAGKPARHGKPGVAGGPNIRFYPRATIKNVDRARVRKLAKNGVVDNFVFHMGLAEIPSYWKAAASPIIDIRAGYLDRFQRRWWKKLLLKGMGEYFYMNNIDFTKPDFIQIISNKTHKTDRTYRTYKTDRADRADRVDRVLIPIGGGKDSIVTLEVLKQKFPVRCFALNPTKRIQKIIEISKTASPIIVKRAIDPKLLELNTKAYLNGHTPFSSYLAFLSIFCAALFDYRYIAFSNERSANEGNTLYKGVRINHQYSKSYEFEKDFRSYSKRYLSDDIEYFSFLRPLSELQIAYAFARVGKSYFPRILSCNRGQKTGRWCKKCPKCLFTYIILYPFMETAALRDIFGGDLFYDKTLRRALDELSGVKRHKPFECVGTHEEVKEALALSIRALEARRKKLPFLLAYARSHLRVNPTLEIHA